MCLGLPMRVIECDDFSALVERGGDRRRISVMLIGRQEPGTMLLIHLDAAVRPLSEVEAVQIDNALAGVEAALTGRDFEHHFADLVGKEPQLPDFLRADGQKT